MSAVILKGIASFGIENGSKRDTASIADVGLEVKVSVVQVMKAESVDALAVERSASCFSTLALINASVARC